MFDGENQNVFFFFSTLQHCPDVILAKLFGNGSAVLPLILEIYFSYVSQAVTPPYISEEFICSVM